MKVQLSIDEYLSEFSYFNSLQLLLDSYYSLNPVDQVISYESMIKDSYPVFYNLLQNMECNLTYKELWFIINKVYSIKGIVDSILTLCNYLGLEGKLVESEHEPNHYDIQVKKVVSNSIGLFIQYFDELIRELLIQDNYGLIIDQVYIMYSSEFITTITNQTILYYNQVSKPLEV